MANMESETRKLTVKLLKLLTSLSSHNEKIEQGQGGKERQIAV
jgi:hypothetical protein